MEKKSYTKRILILILLLSSIIAAIWFVIANRFEDYVKNEILPKLEKHEHWVKIDPDEIKIDKYKLSVSTGEVIIFPNSEIFATKTDQMKFCYNPFKKKIIAHLTGKRVESGKGDLGIYYESSPNDFISFNQEIFQGDFSNMHIESKNSKIDAKDALKNDLIFSAEEDTYTITGSYNPAIANNYQLGVSFGGQSIQHYNADYFKRLISYAYNDFLAMSMEEIDFTSFEYSVKEAEIVGPMDVKGKISLELKKDHFQSIILALKGEKTLSSLASEFNPLEDLYSLNIYETIKNSVEEDKYFISLSNDGNKISTDVDLSHTKSLSDSQKKELLPLMTKAICENTLFQLRSIAKENPDFEAAAKNLVVGDFENIAIKILDFKNLDFKLTGAYDKAARDIDHNLVVKVNNHEINFNGKGKLKEMIYDGSVKVSDPNRLINSIVDFTRVAIYPVVTKVTAEHDSLQQLISNVKDNGFNALGALNKEATLNPGDTLITHLHFSPKEFEFKVNDKPFLDIMTDERVLPFLKGMPKGKNEQQHNDEQQQQDEQPQPAE